MRYTRVRIAGESMTPTLRAGEWWLVRRTRAVGPGDVVLLEHPRRPGQLIVKRVVRATDDGWWVEGDNAAASDDSRAFGPVAPDAIVGRLRWRYGPWGARRGSS